VLSESILMIVPLFLRNHLPTDFLRQKEQPSQIDVENEIEFVRREGFAFLRLLTPATLTSVSIRPNFSATVATSRRMFVEPGHVANDGHNRLVGLRNLAGRRVELGLVATGNHDFGSALGKPRGERPPNPPPGWRPRRLSPLARDGKQIIGHDSCLSRCTLERRRNRKRISNARIVQNSTT